MWATQTEFPAPSFCLALAQLLWAFAECPISVFASQISKTKQNKRGAWCYFVHIELIHHSFYFEKILHGSNIEANIKQEYITEKGSDKSNLQPFMNLLKHLSQKAFTLLHSDIFI